MSSFLGNVEEIANDAIRGWILATDDPSRHCIVELREAGRVLTRAVASDFRQDLPEDSGGDGNCGFSLRIPSSLRDDKEHVLQVVEESSGRVLMEDSITLRLPSETAGAGVAGTSSEILEMAALPSPVRLDDGVGQCVLRTPIRQRQGHVRNGLALISTSNFLPFAKLTAKTFLTYHSDFEVFVLIVDGGQEQQAAFPEGTIVRLMDLGLRNAEWYSAKYTSSEFANALKPVFLSYLGQFVESVIYLDCDIAVFSPMTEMLTLLENHSLVLIPHMLTPAPRPEQFWVHPTRADTFHAGLINAGCFGARLGECEQFLQDWEEMNFATGAFFDGAGSQTDQQHLNWALISVPNVCVLTDDRYNVAYWNLHERDLRVSASDQGSRFSVGGRPLAFFHFSGYDVHDRLRLSRHDSRHSVYNFPAVAELLNWYSDEILNSPCVRMLHAPYQFDRLANGLLLERFLRQILKKYETYIPKYDCQSVAGADALCGFLMDPLPATRSMLPLIAAEIYDARPDLQTAFPNAHTNSSAEFLRWFFHHAGSDFGIGVQFLVDRFRRTLASDSVRGFAEEVLTVLNISAFRFLGPDRVTAVHRLRVLGRGDLADSLGEAATEWVFFTDVSASLEIYLRRPDLQAAYPDILGEDHDGFVEWMVNHAPRELRCPAIVAERFRGRTSSACLPRIFSYLARQEHLAELCRASMLFDEIDLLLRALIRDAGEGLEYDLEDVVVFRFVHRNARHLLVPIYLELPYLRRQVGATRVQESNVAQLPAEIRAQVWARIGCEVHASCFERFESLLEEEVRKWSAKFLNRSGDVFEFLRDARRGRSALSMIELPYRTAIRRLPLDDSLSEAYENRLISRRHKPGVNIFGFFASDIGVGESSRGLAQAISKIRPVNRIPLHTSQVQDGTKLTSLFQRFDYLTDTNVFVSYPHQREDLLSFVRPEQIAGRRNIVHLAWEQKDANPWWRVVYDRYDEIWTISNFAAIPFRKMFPDRVRVVLNVLDFDSFPKCEEEGHTRLGGDRLKFLFVFDAGSSMERKNPEAVIDAFVRAFKGTRHQRRVMLTLKVGGMSRPDHSARVARLKWKAALSGLDIRFDSRQLHRIDMLRMIASADCYVSLHRSEGFGYTMAEAMFYSVPVVASGYSGNLDYMTPENSFLVPCREVYVKNADGPFQRGSIWGEPDVDIAAELMRGVAEQPAIAMTLGKRGRETVTKMLDANAVAETVRTCF